MNRGPEPRRRPRSRPPSTPFSRSSRSHAGRGQSELVGLVLLFGMVLAGAVLIFAAGGVVLDSVESGAEQERTELVFDQTTSQIQDAFDGDRARTVPGAEADRTIEENTTRIEFRRVNVTAAPGGHDDLHWDAGDHGHAHDVRLNALVYDVGDEHLVYEGGGEWHVAANGHTMMRSPPEAAFVHDDSAGLNVNLVDVEPGSSMGSRELVADPATRNAVDTTAMTTALDYYDPGAGADYGNDLKIVIDSEYAGGWEQFFETTDDIDVTASDVHYFDADDTGSGEVVLIVEDVLTPRRPAFEIVGSELDVDDTVALESGESVEAEVTVENVGNVEGSTPVEFDVAGDVSATETVDDLDPGDRETVTLELDAETDLDGVDGIDFDDRDDDADQYGAYPFNVTTADDRANGTVFLSTPDAFYRVENSTHDKRAGVVEVETTFTNVGELAGDYDPDVEVVVDVEGEDRELTHEFDDLDLGTVEAWEESTFTFEINRSKAVYGEYDYTVSFVDDNEANNPDHEDLCPDVCRTGGSFTIESGEGEVGVDPDEIFIEGDAQVNASLIGTEMTNEAPELGFISSGKRDNVYVLPDFFGDTVYYPGYQASFRDATTGEWVGYGTVEPELRRAGTGNVEVEFLAAPPEGPGDTDPPAKNPTGGWVAASGESDPVPDCDWDPDARDWACEWQWNANEIVWSDDGGYDLAIGPGSEYELTWDRDAYDGQFEEPERLQQLEGLTASLVVGDQRHTFRSDGSVDTGRDPNDVTPEKHNVNGFETQYESFDFGLETENQAGVTFEATQWECDQWGYGGVDDRAGATYYAIDCVDFGEDYTRVDVSEQETAGSDDGFIRTRDRGNNSINDLEGLLPTQRNFQEIFEDGSDGIDVDDGEIELDEGDFAFMMELEMDLGSRDAGTPGDPADPPDGLIGNFGIEEDWDRDSWAPAYDGPYAEYLAVGADYTGVNRLAWDIAQRYSLGTDNEEYVEHNAKYDPDYPGTRPREPDVDVQLTQPNFNDAVGVVQVEFGESEIDADNPLENPQVDGHERDAEVTTDPIEGPEDERGVEVGVGEIVIR